MDKLDIYALRPEMLYIMVFFFFNTFNRRSMINLRSITEFFEEHYYGIDTYAIICVRFNVAMRNLLTGTIL